MDKSLENNLKPAQLILLNMLQDVDRICRKNGLNYWLDKGTLLGAIRHQGFIPWDDDVDIAMPREDYLKFISIAKDELDCGYEIENLSTNKECTVAWTKIRDKSTLLLEKGKKVEGGVFIDIFPVDNIKKFDLKFFAVKLLCKLMTHISWLKEDILYGGYSSKKNSSIKMLLSKVKAFSRNRVAYSVWKKACSTNRRTGNNKDKSFYTYGMEVKSMNKFSAEDIFPLKQVLFEKVSFNCPQNYHKHLVKLYGEKYTDLPSENERIPKHTMNIVFNVKKVEGT
jgi:lipopolysaccharide cholinephosphotransferase